MEDHAQHRTKLTVYKRSSIMFIVIEGLDGTGKSSIAKMLATTLNAELLSTPDTSLKKIRPIIDVAYENHPLARQLFYASSVVHLSAKIKQLIEEEKSVVVDRYWLSTKVYHNWKCEGQHFQLKELEHHIQIPDVTIYLKLPLTKRTARLSGRKENTCEDNLTLIKETDEKLSQAYKSFQEFSITGQWIEVDVTNDTDNIVKEIIAKINALAICGRSGPPL